MRWQTTRWLRVTRRPRQRSSKWRRMRGLPSMLSGREIPALSLLVLRSTAPYAPRQVLQIQARQRHLPRGRRCRRQRWRRCRRAGQRWRRARAGGTACWCDPLSVAVYRIVQCCTAWARAAKAVQHSPSSNVEGSERLTGKACGSGLTHCIWFSAKINPVLSRDLPLSKFLWDTFAEKIFQGQPCRETFPLMYSSKASK